MLDLNEKPKFFISYVLLCSPLLILFVPDCVFSFPGRHLPERATHLAVRFFGLPQSWSGFSVSRLPISVSGLPISVSHSLFRFRAVQLLLFSHSCLRWSHIDRAFELVSSFRSGLIRCRADHDRYFPSRPESGLRDSRAQSVPVADLSLWISSLAQKRFAVGRSD
jgi:hypothetical protein